MTFVSIAKIDYLILLCRDMRAAIDFYLNRLQLRLVEDHPSWVRFKLHGTFLTLRPRGQWLSWFDGEVPGRSASVQLAFQVPYDDVDLWHERLASDRVDIVQPPVDQEFGHRTLFVRDPDWNIVEIFAEIER
ncbi:MULTISPECIES: VOC family protein [unclassified Roseitalea]|uniref:VOC family protein n=1 Tax=unclassified Roseitalea TaxID=2639107 RepID=UPI00273D72B9|nr:MULTISPECIES: VOC family protein [unclassified Roseitalea]